MKNDDDKTDPKQAKTSPHFQPERDSLFSEREVRMIVKDFVSAYLSGKIKLALPTANEIMGRSTDRGKPMDYDEAVKTELKVKNEFRQRISICAGVKNYPKEAS